MAKHWAGCKSMMNFKGVTCKPLYRAARSQISALYTAGQMQRMSEPPSSHTSSNGKAMPSRESLPVQRSRNTDRTRAAAPRFARHCNTDGKRPTATLMKILGTPTDRPPSDSMPWRWETQYEHWPTCLLVRHTQQ